ncbi:MAG: tRNA pseudouridine(55) synthase TruB [Patescibacteria group bacterium]|nr:tRNA pseudouridine(55) synthase TruB [Patescibacteria group bacterium]
MLDFKNGLILLVDKEPGWTSFDIVAKIRSTLRRKFKDTVKHIKVGHAGTLDPFATGLLIILIGKKTKNQEGLMKLDKKYIATLKLGATSTTGDPEGIIKKTTSFIPKPITIGDIETVLEGFLGETFQTPPAHSAIKINGKRAYMLARAGKEFKLKPRKITIYDIKILDYKWPLLKIETSVSSGTYIRKLAEDTGKSLGCGAYLTGLRRTKIGEYDISDSKKINIVLKDVLNKNLLK